jgi:hypothetical protein
MASPYNFFATVLADMLAGPPDGDPAQPPRGMTLDDLDSARFAGSVDKDDLRLHAEVIRRLKQSLTTQYTYPVLSKQNFKKVVAMAGLSRQELLMLVAAIMATRIQRELATRIGPPRAYLAAERLLPILVEGMQELQDEDGFDFRGALAMADLTEFDRRYADALAAIDRGAQALTAVPYVSDRYEKEATARQAHDAFTLALEKLGQQDNGEAWAYWRREAEQGQAAAAIYLRPGGANDA